MKLLAMLALMGVAVLTHGAEMYRWVDEKGVVNYTPYPPPASIKKVEQKKIGGNYVQTGEASYSLQLATKNYPVTFYATPDCGPCKMARAHLDKRGIPYTEKNPSTPATAEELEAYKKLPGGGVEIPVIQVGQLKTLKGYLASDWDAALDQAGYPSTAIPGAKPAAPAPVAASTPPAAAK
jgi:glutaredoxin